MAKTDQVKAGLKVLASRFTGKPIPVAVRWNLLNRCAYRCVYCTIWHQDASGEIPTAKVKEGLKELAELGTYRISFSGGEPLLRDDIGEIVSYAKEVGISPSMNTSGYRLQERIDDLKDLDLLKISIDGPKEVHDKLVGREGAFDTAMEAAELASTHLKKISFTTTITSYNVHHLEEMLNVAASFDTVVALQPIAALFNGIENTNLFAPTPEEMKKAYKWLIEEKRNGNRHIRNSMAELEYISHWPDYPKLKCSAGKIFLIIDSDGTILPCDRIPYNGTTHANIKTSTITEALKNLPEVDCRGCGFCGTLELNFLYSLNFRPLLDVIRLVN